MGISLKLVRANGDDASGVVLWSDDTQISSFWIQHDCPEDHTEARMGIAGEIESMLTFLGWGDRLEVEDKGYVDNPYEELFEKDPWGNEDDGF